MSLRRRREGSCLEIRVAAVLVWFLSSCPSLAVFYLQQRLFKNFDFLTDMTTPELAGLSLLDWFKDSRVRSLVMDAIESLDHPIRYPIREVPQQQRLPHHCPGCRVDAA